MIERRPLRLFIQLFIVFMKKSYIALVALTATALTLTACGSKDKPEANTQTGTTATVTTGATKKVEAPKKPVAKELPVATTGAIVYVNYIGRITDKNGKVTRKDYVTDCSKYEVFDTSYEDVAKACKIFNPGRKYGGITGTLPVTLGKGGVLPSENIVKTPKQEKKNADGTTGARQKGDVVVTPTGKRGIIIAVDDKEVTIDFNMPIAGKDLTFNIEIVRIEEAPKTKPTIKPTLQEKPKAQATEKKTTGKKTK